MVNSTKAKERSLFLWDTTKHSYLFVTESTIDQLPFYLVVLIHP